MAVVSRLPNGYVVLMMTPREATCLSDEILEPEGYPWQASENQMVATEVKMKLRAVVAEEAESTLNKAAGQLQEELERQHNGS